MSAPWSMNQRWLNWRKRLNWVVTICLTTPLFWRDQSGHEEPVDLPAGSFVEVALSPSGQQIALSIGENGAGDIWVSDFNLPGVLNRVTNLGDAENPVWANDGNSLYFDRTGDDDPADRGIWQVSASGIGEPEQLIPGETVMLARDIGPDDEVLIQSNLGTEGDILRGDFRSGDKTVRPLIASVYGETLPSISPDGRLIAYVGFETGVREVYVRPYPDVDSNRWRVSTTGGDEPRWGSNNVLYYLSNPASPQQKLITLEIEYDTEFRVQGRTEIEVENLYTRGRPSYSIDSENNRLLLIKYLDEGERQSWGDGVQPVIANVVSNFFAEIDGRLRE